MRSWLNFFWKLEIFLSVENYWHLSIFWIKFIEYSWMNKKISIWLLGEKVLTKRLIKGERLFYAQQTVQTQTIVIAFRYHMVLSGGNTWTNEQKVCDMCMENWWDKRSEERGCERGERLERDTREASWAKKFLFKNFAN